MALNPLSDLATLARVGERIADEIKEEKAEDAEEALLDALQTDDAAALSAELERVRRQKAGHDKGNK